MLEALSHPFRAQYRFTIRQAHYVKSVNRQTCEVRLRQGCDEISKNVIPLALLPPFPPATPSNDSNRRYRRTVTTFAAYREDVTDALTHSDLFSSPFLLTNRCLSTFPKHFNPANSSPDLSLSLRSSLFSQPFFSRSSFPSNRNRRTSMAIHDVSTISLSFDDARTSRDLERKSIVVFWGRGE